MIASREAQAEHERRVIGEFLDFLRGQGRDIGQPTFNPGKPDADAHVLIDGIFTAVELGCGYYERPDELWRMLRERVESPVNTYASSSGVQGQQLGRVVGVLDLPALARELQRKLNDKAGYDYGPRAYLLLDGSHDGLGPSVTTLDLLALLRVPVDRKVTAIYLVEPRFETPRRFLHVAGER